MAQERTTLLQGKPLRLEGPELRPGDIAPSFDTVDSAMQPVTLESTRGSVRIFSVVPSLDTPVCDAQTKRFNEAAGDLRDIAIYTVSMDLPFAQRRWCGNFGVDNVKMLSDHRNGSFGRNYGTLISDLRILSRAIFVVDKEDRIRHVEYVGEVADHPNYEQAVNAAKQARG